jgi:hypothetical protein
MDNSEEEFYEYSWIGRRMRKIKIIDMCRNWNGKECMCDNDCEFTGGCDLCHDICMERHEEGQIVCPIYAELKAEVED